MQPPGHTPSHRSTLIVASLHVLAFVALAAWSWRKWPDPLVDFGRELYVPWQIARGKALYRDIASLFGPLSPYVNALWFRLFAVSLTTLAVMNLLVLGATMAAIYRLLAIATDRIAASAGTLAALLLCGFSQYLDVGNYNFVTPYSHEATHGFALAVGAIVFLYHAVSMERDGFRRTSLYTAAGFCFGLVLLTKPELALAACIALAAGFAAAAALGSDVRRSAARGLIPFVVAAAAGPLAFVLFFRVSGGMSIAGAIRATANGWIVAFTTSIATNPFYLRVSGFDAPWTNAFRMLRIFVGAAVVLAAALALAAARPQSRAMRFAIVALQAVFLLAAALAFPMFQVSRALPLFAITGGIGAIRLFANTRSSREARLRAIALMMWAAFALALLAKMILNAQIYHYGFYLALPSLTVAVITLVALVPDAVQRATGRDGTRLRLMMLAIVVVAIAPDLALANLAYRGKALSVGSNGDRFWAADTTTFWQGRAVRDALAWIDGNVPKDATIAVLPEGVMINYLSRRDTPIRFINFMPPELIAFGEPPIVKAFEEHPPDFVFVVHRNTREYGYASFGSDPAYGRDILGWVDRHYRAVHTIGHDPLSANGYGIEIRCRVE